jgi:hypothetical protein
MENEKHGIATRWEEGKGDRKLTIEKIEHERKKAEIEIYLR